MLSADTNSPTTTSLLWTFHYLRLQLSLCLYSPTVHDWKAGLFLLCTPVYMSKLGGHAHVCLSCAPWRLHRVHLFPRIYSTVLHLLLHGSLSLPLLERSVNVPLFIPVKNLTHLIKWCWIQHSDLLNGPIRAHLILCNESWCNSWISGCYWWAQFGPRYCRLHWQPIVVLTFHILQPLHASSTRINGRETMEERMKFDVHMVSVLSFKTKHAEHPEAQSLLWLKKYKECGWDRHV